MGIQSCFPYVARRLIGDDSPRAQVALKDLLYGAGDMIDPERLKDTVSGFRTYTTTTKIIGGKENLVGDAGREASSGVNGEAALTLAKDSADIILAAEGNLVQDLLVEESATAASAQLKDAFRDALIDTPERIRNSLPFGAGNLLPKPPVAALEPFLKKSEEEEKAQHLLEQLLTLAPSLPSDISEVLPNNSNNLNNINGSNNERNLQAALENIDLEQLAWVSKELRENVPKYAPLVGGLGNKFTSSVLDKVSDSIELALKEKQESAGLSLDDQLVRASAQGVANIANQGASTLKASRNE